MSGGVTSVGSRTRSSWVICPWTVVARTPVSTPLTRNWMSSPASGTSIWYCPAVSTTLMTKLGLSAVATMTVLPTGAGCPLMVTLPKKRWGGGCWAAASRGSAASSNAIAANAARSVMRCRTVDRGGCFVFIDPSSL